MKVVILAAGIGKRMRPLTLTTPKPLLPVNGKPIIEYILESFPPEIEEIIIVVNYLGEQIKKHLGKNNRGLKITYVSGSLLGSAYSLLATKKYLKNERFLVVQGDEIPNQTDIVNCLTKELSCLTFESCNPQANGIGFLRKDGSLKKIIEKPKTSTSTLGIDGVMVIHTDIFNYIPVRTRGEYYFSTLMSLFVRDHKVFPVPTQGLIGDLTTPNDLVRVGNILKLRGR